MWMRVWMLGLLVGCGKNVAPEPQVPRTQGHPELVCPTGTTAWGYGPPQGAEAYCRREIAPGRFVRDGPVIAWHTGTQQRRQDGSALNGLRNGAWNTYFPNGVIESKGNYLLDEKQGRWETFHASGTPASVGEFDSGREVGMWQFWNAESTWRSEGAFELGTRTGIWMEFDTRISTVTERIYQNGRLVSVIEK